MAENPTVLVAEHDPKVLDLVEIVLISRDYAVTLARNGHEALSHLQQSTPELAILGATMPHISGLEVAGRMRRVPRLENVPILMLATRDEQHALDDSDVRLDEVLGKPFGSKELLSAVRSLVKPPKVTRTDITMHGQQDERPNVLIVEDSAALRGLIGDILGRQGYFVRSAENVPQARSLITKHLDQMNLVLLDVNLPGGTGFELLQLIRERSDVPVFILSSLRREEQIERGMKLGAQAFIEKPFNPRDLVKRIQAHLSPATGQGKSKA